MSEQNQSPFLAMPAVVAALALVLGGVELLLSAGQEGIAGGPAGVGWRLDAYTRFAFSGDILRWMFSTGQYPVNHILRFFSFSFVHAGFTHALFAIVMLLALGKMVASVLGPLRFVIVFFVSAFGGALAYTLTGDATPLIGAFPGVYGLIGAFTFLRWLWLGQVGAEQLQAFSLIGVLMGVQLLFGVFFEVGSDWVAELAGFVVGFVLSTLLIPGGFAHLIARIRRN